MSFLEKLGLVNPSEEVEVKENVEEKKLVGNVGTVPAPAAKGKSAGMRFAAQKQATTTSGQIVGKIDNEVYEKLSEAIERHNLDGNDFLEFMQSLNGMSSLSVDEKTKFNMVFTTLSTSSGGMDKATLVNSIKHYLSVIEKEKSLFQREMEGATETTVTTNIQESERLIQLANKKTEQIAILQQEIESLSSESVELNNVAEEFKVKIAQKEADFEITVSQLTQQLNTYDSKINEYLQ